MKIKINQPLLGVNNEPIKTLPNQAGTLRDACINSLLVLMDGDTEKQKLERYEVFKKIRDAKTEVELKAEEIVTIKRSIGKHQPPLILGQCFEMLEGKK